MDSQSATSPSQLQQSSLETGTAGSTSGSAQQLRGQSASHFEPCRPPVWYWGKREEAQQGEAHARSGKETSLGPGTHLAPQSDSVAEKRSLLGNFAPHSCVNPMTCQHPEYNSGSIDPVPPQRRQATSQCFSPIVGSGHSQLTDSGSSTSEPSCHEPAQPLVSQSASVREPCRQTIWRRKKREEARMEPYPWTRPEPGVLRVQDPNPMQQQLGQDMDLGAGGSALAVEKWPRGPAVKNVGLKNKVLDSGTCVSSIAVVSGMVLIDIKIAIYDMRQQLNSRQNRPEGQDYTRHEQVLMFMEAQKEKPFETRVNLAMGVANRFQKRHRVQRRILEHEKMWIKERRIPEGNQGKVKNGHVLSILQNDGTIKVAREQFVDKSKYVYLLVALRVLEAYKGR